MPIHLKDKGGEDFAPIPAGLHHAVCVLVADLGTQTPPAPYKPRRQIVFTWEIPGVTYEVEENGQKKQIPRLISKTYTQSLSPKSNLRPDLESWRGKPFAEAELDGFDPRRVLGANAFLNLIHEQKNGKTYANVKSINPLPQGMPKKDASQGLVYFSLDDFPKDVVFPQTMPDWIRAKIMLSDEYIKKQQGGHQPSEEEQANRNSNGADEDVPF